MTHARSVVVNSHMVRSAVHGLLWIARDRIHLVRNAVNLRRFAPSRRPKSPTVVFPGGQVPRKGLRVAVALRSCSDVELLVLGQGFDSRLQRWARERNPRVRFVGQIDDPERIIGAAHALVLPTCTILRPMPCWRRWHVVFRR